MQEISGKVEELEKLNGKNKDATDALKKEVQDNSCRIKALENKLEQG